MKYLPLLLLAAAACGSAPNLASTRAGLELEPADAGGVADAAPALLELNASGPCPPNPGQEYRNQCATGDVLGPVQISEACYVPAKACLYGYLWCCPAPTAFGLLVGGGGCAAGLDPDPYGVCSFQCRNFTTDQTRCSALHATCEGGGVFGGQTWCESI